VGDGVAEALQPLVNQGQGVQLGRRGVLLLLHRGAACSGSGLAVGVAALADPEEAAHGGACVRPVCLYVWNPRGGVGD
jgi:hypothetical protein